MTALHQFGAQMLNLSKRLESYPTTGPAPKQALPPSPLLLPPPTYSDISTHRLIRSTTNASIVNQRANNRHEVGDETHVHYNTRPGGCNNKGVVSPLQTTPKQPAETISVEQHRYISRTCHQRPPQNKKISTLLLAPRVSSKNTARYVQLNILFC